MAVVSCGEGSVVCPGAGGAGVAPDRTYYYLFEYDPPNVPQMTGEDFKLSGTRADFDTSPGASGRPIVTMEFTDSGSDKFEDITRGLWIRGKLRNVPQHFAIVLDREIKTFPQIDFTDSSLSGGIGGGRAQIQGLESFQEAKEIALVLQTGALPVKFETLDRTDISATLGKDSLEEAWKAAIGGLLLVALFLVIFYRFLGLVAVVGLAIYAAFLYATILIFDVTMTLPGFAGLVLTFGVAADANIVIFERIKEEVRAGRSMRAAIAQGYRKGFAAIIDANVVTAITAMVLFAVATASVRGFALMLLLGTLLSLLTAVAATRAILALLGGFGWLGNPRVMGATGEGLPKWLRWDYIGRRRIWFAISGTAAVISIAAIGILGLNFGIDFRGGTHDLVPYPGAHRARGSPARGGRDRAGQCGHSGPWRVDRRQLHELPDPHRVADERGAERAAIGPRERSRRDLVRREKRLRELRASDREQRAARDSREPAADGRLHLVPVPVEVLGRRLVSLGHDLLIAIGIYALTGREVSTATVAALLTILGYSMYDTIIIFDRIRENVPLMRRASMRVIGNVSLWEVIPRSLATTFITLLPVASLYVLGGDTLKDFAFALLVGIGAGSYSSIFLAAPLLAALKEREPEFARRRDDLGALAGVSSIGGTLATEAEEFVSDSDDSDESDNGAPEAARAPVPAPVAGSTSSKRERRRQRRASRPHGRAR